MDKGHRHFFKMIKNQLGWLLSIKTEITSVEEVKKLEFSALLVGT